MSEICPQCKNEFNLRNNECEICGYEPKIEIEEEAVSPPPILNEEDKEELILPQTPSPILNEEEIGLKNCPYCGEKIKDVAIKCRFCGEILNSSKETIMVQPVATPTVPIPPGMGKMNDQEKDKLFGEVAVGLDFITLVDVSSALESQKVDEAIGARKPIGAYLLDAGKLNKDQIGIIVVIQEKVIAEIANQTVTQITREEVLFMVAGVVMVYAGLFSDKMNQHKDAAAMAWMGFFSLAFGAKAWLAYFFERPYRLLIAIGCAVSFYFIFGFDTSVNTAFGRVNNLGLMQTKNIGIGIGGFMVLIGIILFVSKKNQD